MFLSLPFMAGRPVPGAEPDSWSEFTAAEKVTLKLARGPSSSTAEQSLWSRGTGWLDPAEPAGGTRAKMKDSPHIKSRDPRRTRLAGEQEAL